MKNISLFLAVLLAVFASVKGASQSVNLGPYSVVTSGISNPGSFVGSKHVSNDNRRVVYVANFESVSERAIYMTPITGGAPVRLSPRLANSPGYFFGASNPYITHDSRRVLFTHRSTSRSEGRTLYVSPITGSSAPLVLVDSNTPFNWWPSADDEGVYFWENLSQISYVPIRGGDFQVVAKLPTGVDLDIGIDMDGTLLVQPLSGVDSIGDGVQVIVLGSDNNIYGYVFGQPSEFFTRINNTDLQNFQPHPFNKPKLSPDGSHLLLSDSTTKSLYTISLNTGLVSNVSPRVNSGQDFRGFEFSPDSSRVVYVSDRLVNSKYEIFSSTLDGSQIVNLSPSVIPPSGLGGKFSFLASSQQLIFQGLFGDAYIAPINGETAAEYLCDCGIFQRTGFEDADDTVLLASQDGTFFYSSTSNRLLRLRTRSDNERTTFLHWIKPGKILVFGIRETSDEGDVNETLYRSSLHAHGANTASIFESPTSARQCLGYNQYIFPRNNKFIIFGATDKRCEKRAYFKVSTNDRKVSQLSEYRTLKLDINTGGVSPSFFDQKATVPNFTFNNSGSNRDQVGFSPRGTHIFVPANRRGIGFWGIDLSQKVEVDETLCFPTRAHNNAVTQICF